MEVEEKKLNESGEEIEVGKEEETKKSGKVRDKRRKK